MNTFIQWFDSLRDEFTAMTGELGSLGPALLDLPALLVGVLVAGAMILQRLLRQRGDRWVVLIDQWAAAGGEALKPLRRMLAILGVVGLHGLKVALVALLILGFLRTGLLGEGVWARIAADFLYAFITVELIRLGLNGVLEPRARGVRLAAMDDESARLWEQKLSGLIRWLGYGLLLVVPIVALAGAAMADVAAAVILAFALIRGVLLLRASRQPIRQWLQALSRRGRGVFVKALLRLLAPVWHWAVGIYALTLSIIVLAGSPAQVDYVLGASGLTLLIVLIGGFLGHWLTVFAETGIDLPEHVQHRLPQLQGRLQAWVPKLLRILHGLLTILIIALIADAWRLWDFMLWLSSPAGQVVSGSVVALLGIAVLALIAWLVTVSWIEDRLNPETGAGEPGAREKTLLALFRNAVAIVIITLAVMIALSEIGVDIGPLLAGAGVIGLAVGFGAQKLVQDIITGVFIQLEDAIHQDDYITAAGISGTVERLSIRSLGLRDLTGTLHVIPFSSVDTVSNFTRDFGYHLGEYGVAYRENIGEVIEHLHRAYEQLCADESIAKDVTGPLEVDGVTALADSSVNLRVRIRTTAGMHWAVGRAYNRYVKEVFDEAGIEIPFPHMTLYFGEDKQGLAPPAHIAIRKEESTED